MHARCVDACLDVPDASRASGAAARAQEQLLLAKVCKHLPAALEHAQDVFVVLSCLLLVLLQCTQDSACCTLVLCLPML